MDINLFNQLSRNDAQTELIKCCSSLSWVEKMVKGRPYDDFLDLVEKSEEVWFSLAKGDWLEAFSGHPKIGDINSLKKKFAETKRWANNEQAGMKSASDDIIKELAHYNDIYEKKFGFIFIVCATGKSAEEMLELIKRRYQNNPEEEIKIAVMEQNKITKLRLEKL